MNPKTAAPSGNQLKLLAKANSLDSPNAKATLIATALASGLWDILSMDDRQRWCERGDPPKAPRPSPRGFSFPLTPQADL